MFIRHRASAGLFFFLATLPLGVWANGETPRPKDATSPSRRVANGLVAHHQKFANAQRTDLVARKQDGGYEVRYEVSAYHTIIFRFDERLRPLQAEAHTWDPKAFKRGKPTVRNVDGNRALAPMRIVAANLCRSAQSRGLPQLNVSALAIGGKVYVNEWADKGTFSTRREFDLASGKRLVTQTNDGRARDTREWNQQGKPVSAPQLQQAKGPANAPKPGERPKAVAWRDPLAEAAQQIVEGGVKLVAGFRVARVRTASGHRLMLGRVAKVGPTQALVKVAGKTYLVANHEGDGKPRVTGRIKPISMADGKVTYRYQPIVNGVRQPIVYERQTNAFPKGFGEAPRVASRTPTPARAR